MAADAAVAPGPLAAPTMTGAPADPARPAAGLGLPVEAASAAWAAAAPLAGAAVVPAAVSEAAVPSMRAVDAAWAAAVDADAKTTLLGKKIGCAVLHSQFFWGISFYLVP